MFDVYLNEKFVGNVENIDGFVKDVKEKLQELKNKLPE